MTGQRPEDQPSIYGVKCPDCGFLTDISWKHNTSRPRFCRHCGAQIAEPIHRERYAEAPRLTIKCDHPDLCLIDIGCHSGSECCISCPDRLSPDSECVYRCSEARVWLSWPPEEELLICEDLRVIIIEEVRS